MSIVIDLLAGLIGLATAISGLFQAIYKYRTAKLKTAQLTDAIGPSSSDLAQRYELEIYDLEKKIKRAKMSFWIGLWVCVIFLLVVFIMKIYGSTTDRNRAEIIYFKSNRTSVESGKQVELSWKVVKADKCEIRWGDDHRKSVPLQSKMVLSIFDNTIIKLTCSADKQYPKTKTLSIASQKLNKPKFTWLTEVINDLDCSNKNNASNRRIKLEEKHLWKKVIIKATVHKLDLDKHAVYLDPKSPTPLGSAPGGAIVFVSKFFTVPPVLIFADTKKLSGIDIGDTATFKCNVLDHCKENLFHKEGVKFNDCVIEKKH